jgi:hypothetical protein
MSLLLALAVVSQSQPGFVDVLREARYTAQCGHMFSAQACPPLPVIEPTPAMDETAEDFAYLVAMFLRHQRETLTSGEHLQFETSLNVMRSYNACLDTELSGAADVEFAGKESRLRVIKEAGDACGDKRASMLQRLSFDMPDFHRFDAASDNDKAGAKVAAALRQVELLAADYHGMRRTKPQQADGPPDLRTAPTQDFRK